MGLGPGLGQVAGLSHCSPPVTMPLREMVFHVRRRPQNKPGSQGPGEKLLLFEGAMHAGNQEGF